MKTNTKTSHGLYTFHRFPTQNAWVEWTKTGILPEDAPVLMGESPWKTEEILLAEKTGNQPREITQPMQKATSLRPKILENYKKSSGEDLQKANIQSKEFSWMRASLDGISKNRWHIVEIKAGEYAYKKACELQRVPPFYYGEGQHILAITGLQYLTFHFHTGNPNDKPLNLSLRRNNTYIETLIQKESAFVQKIKTQTLNPSRELIEKVIQAIQQTGPKVDYKTYQMAVPTFLSKNGTLTELGKKILEKK